jgi:omega-amidase
VKDLQLALVQQEIVPDNPTHNLSVFAEMLAPLEDVDLVILPEVFTTGFSATARSHAEEAGGRAYHWMAEQASRLQSVVTGSLVVKEGENFFNRLVWMRPDGSFSEYNKRHLFRMAGEHKRYEVGQERVLVELAGWRILPLICYDLRFPVWSRNCQDYDLAIYVANWPSARALHWNRLLQARAIENLSYVAGVNRVGFDEKHQHYAGDSTVYGPAGEVILHSQEAAVLRTSLSAQQLQDYRSAFPAHLDADQFQLL